MEKVAAPEWLLQTKDDQYLATDARHDKEKAYLQQRNAELAKKYEEKCLTLLVATSNLYDNNVSAQNQINNLLQEIPTLLYQHKMGDDKIKTILHRHHDMMKTMIIDALNEEWTAWSQQVTELQLLCVDHKIRKTQGQAYL